MDYFLLYLFTRLDALNALLYLASFVGAVACFCLSMRDEKAYDLLQKRIDEQLKESGK